MLCRSQVGWEQERILITPQLPETTGGLEATSTTWSDAKLQELGEMGVLKALEQNGIVVDMIAGTSAGAMTGTRYAAGLDVACVTERFVEALKPACHSE